MWHASASSVALRGKGSEEGQWPCLPFCLRESCPPGLALMSDTSVPLHMAMVPLKLPPWCWSSEGLSLSKSVCRLFKRNCLGFQQFVSLTQSPLVFADRIYGDLSSWHWIPGPRSLVLGWGSSLLRYPPLNFYPPHMDVGPASSVSLPLLPVWMDVVSLIP